MNRPTLSSDSLSDASRDRAQFSGHGNALGAAGYRIEGKTGTGEFLSRSGDSAIVNPRQDGFGRIRIGAAWDEMEVRGKGWLGKYLTRHKPVDLDLGCLYELQDGTKGAVQAFGEMYGAFDDPPFIVLSGDERTGKTEGEDELIRINGAHWKDIKKILFYIYIYNDAPHWASIRPQIQIFVPEEKPIVIVPSVHDSKLAVCALVSMENAKDGIRITNHTEFFPGHAEMDRAFGFGLKWDDGSKA
jgi:tellurite resistance protein TerA